MPPTPTNNAESSLEEPSSGRRFRTDSLASSVILLLGVSIIQRGVGFGRGVLFCRWLSPEELGLWEMAFSFLLLAAPLAVLGLPGSFGRYLEHFRQRGQLRVFLRRTSIWTAVLSAATVAIILFAAPHLSTLIFGKADETTATMLVAASLAAVILHHFLGAVFTAMRMFRVASMMHFSHSIGFAVIALGLLYWWRLEAISIVIAYGTACMLSSIGAILWSRSLIGEMDADSSTVCHRAFWPKLMRFALWVWVSNLLCNLFGIVDRYMIVHYSGLSPDEALGQVGHYHSSRIVPLLIVSIAELLGGIVLPYLSKDWEAGRQKEVSNRLNFVLKMSSLGMLVASVAVLAGAPLLFEVAFRGKYDGGLTVLPMTLCYCTTFGIMILLQDYLWTAEKGRLCSIPMAIGLIANIVLNLLLLPAYGLVGAVLATTAANVLCLALTFILCACNGMHIDRATILLGFAPLAICGGVDVTAATVCCLLLFAAPGRGLFTDAEWDQLKDYCASGIARLRRGKNVTAGSV